jgi:pseudouridine kinase
MICVGGAVLDRKYRARKQLIPETSNPVDGYRSLGGVGRNVAENLVRLGVDLGFVSIVGDDEAGRTLMHHLSGLGADISLVVTSTERPTAEYVAILDPGNDLALGLADMAIFDLLTPDRLDGVWPALDKADWVFVDCNMPAKTIAAIIERRRGSRFRLAVDTVSSPKAAKLPSDLAGIDLLFTNRDEANAILGISEPAKRLSPADAAAALRRAGASEVVVTDGPQGYAVASSDRIVQMPAVPARPIDITGAGDAMIAGTLYCVIAGEPLYQAARTGALLATLTTESAFSVHPELSPRLLAANQHRIPA